MDAWISMMPCASSMTSTHSKPLAALSALKRLLAGVLVSVAAALLLSPAIANAVPAPTTDMQTRLELRPHSACGPVDNILGGPLPDSPHMTKLTTGSCLEYEVKDPQTRQTPIQATGDTLDMDLIVRNPTGAGIRRVRAWLAYDPSILSGDSVTIDPSFTMPSPDEQAFSATDGYIKIGASTDSPQSGPLIVVARIVMHILPTNAEQTVISTYTTKDDVTGESVVIAVTGGQEQNLLHAPLSALLVRLTGTGISSSSQRPVEHAASSARSSAQSSSRGKVSSAASSSVSASAKNSLFTQLQVLALRVTTEGTSAYLSWDALKSAEVVGYNVYYGTISGQYIQRRGVDKLSTTLTIHDLVPGTRYYFAVRAVNAAGQETEFSQEVAVVIGQPETSTAPLLASVTQGPQGKAPKTGGTVAGKAGAPSAILLFIVTSAGIGTILALRRQLVALKTLTP